MGKRLNIERQTSLEPQRVQTAMKEITNKGYSVNIVNSNSITFYFKKHIVTFYPYSGWATGKTIKDGRGLKNLLNQI